MNQDYYSNMCTHVFISKDSINMITSGFDVKDSWTRFLESIDIIKYPFVITAFYRFFFIDSQDRYDNLLWDYVDVCKKKYNKNCEREYFNETRVIQIVSKVPWQFVPNQITLFFFRTFLSFFSFFFLFSFTL